MFVHLFNLHVDKMFGCSKVFFLVYLDYKLHLNLTCLCPLFMNQPVDVHIELIKMLVFENIYSQIKDTHTLRKVELQYARMIRGLIKKWNLKLLSS